MEKIDFGDVNKFFVSIGLFLISLSIVFPYFYLKEDFGLSIENSIIEKYSPELQGFIKTKQSYAIKIQSIIPFISILFFIVGCVSLIVGLIRWLKRQSQIDKKYDLDITKLQLEIKSLTPEEKVNKTKQEINEIELESAIEGGEVVGRDVLSSETIGTKPILDYLKVESDVIEIFKRFNSPNFEVLDNQLLGRKYEIDILLKAKSRNFSDRIVEVKYFKKQVSSGIILKSIERLDKYLEYYKANVNELVVPVLILVYSKEALNEVEINSLNQKIDNKSKLYKNINLLKCKFVEDLKVGDLDIENILNK